MFWCGFDFFLGHGQQNVRFDAHKRTNQCSLRAVFLSPSLGTKLLAGCFCRLGASSRLGDSLPFVDSRGAPDGMKLRSGT
jgi:hypothetical protein